MKNRRAFTLVEMLAVMSVGGVLLTLALSLVHRSMQLDSSWREQADVSRALARLSRDFRSDVHLATRVLQGPLSLELMLAGGAEVTYTFAESEIIRALKPTSGPAQREFYIKPGEYQIEIATLFEPARIKLVVRRVVSPKDVPPRIALHLESEIGRFQRIAAREDTTP